MNLPIPDRRAAGRTLANFLEHYQDRYDLVVLAISVNAVPVGFEIARQLDAPFDLFLVHRLSLEGIEDLDSGAVAAGGQSILNEDLLFSRQIRGSKLREALQQQHRELKKKEQALRGDQARLELAGQCVILVDDALVDEATLRAAVKAVRRQQASSVVAALPVASTQALERIRAVTDEVAFIATQEPFLGVDWWYGEHRPVADREARQLLTQAYRLQPSQQTTEGRRNKQTAAI